MSLLSFFFSVLLLLNSFSTGDSPGAIPITTENDPISEIYLTLTNSDGDLPSEEIFELAYSGWEKMDKELKSPLLTIIDFSLASTIRRLWIIDLNEKAILLNSVVAHGRNSGELMASKFSNRPESFQSSLGFYKTGETYIGKHGYSLRLDGLEKGVNDQARNRAIVIHGADYASEAFAKINGRLGRSLGCPALPTELSTKAINLIKDGSLLFVFAKNENYLENSPLLQP
jgi:hypothetical protein